MKMKLAAMAAMAAMVFAAFVSVTQAAQAAVTTMEYDITATGGTISPNPLEADIQVTFDPSAAQSLGISNAVLLSNNFGAANGIQTVNYIGAGFGDGGILAFEVDPFEIVLNYVDFPNPEVLEVYNLFTPQTSFDSTLTGSVTASVVSVSAAPEPTTWALMLLGVGFAGGALRMRRRDARGLVWA